jgi:hypothetical protein
MNAIVSQVVNSNSAQLYQEQVVQYLDVIDGVVFNPNLEGAQFLYRFLLRAMTNLTFLNPNVVKDMFLVWFQMALGKTGTTDISTTGFSTKIFNFPALLMIALKEVDRFPIKTSFHWKLLIAICNSLREELNDDETLLIQQPLFGYILHYLLVPQLQLDSQNIDANNANPISPLAFVLPKETHPVSGWLVYHIAPPLLNVPKSRGFKMRRYLSQYRHIIKNLKQKLQPEPIIQEQEQQQQLDPTRITQLLFDDTNAAWLFAHQPEMFDDEILVKKTSAKATVTANATVTASATVTEDSNVTYILEDEQNQDDDQEDEEEEEEDDDDDEEDDGDDDDDDDEAVLINDEMDDKDNETNQTRGWFSWLAWN